MSYRVVLLLCMVVGCSGEESADATEDPGGLIAILGSSTAAGIGPASADSAWVNRYASYLAENRPRWTVENFAVGGYTTYQVQPDDYVPPPSRPLPALGHNITAALAIEPRALVVNLPSNDQAFGFSTAEQIDNYRRISTLAKEQNIPIWVSTTQPRNFVTQAARDTLLEARDAIIAEFGDRTLDFWTPTAAFDGSIEPELDSGDGIHLNDAGHALLNEVVVAAAIPDRAAD